LFAIPPRSLGRRAYGATVPSNEIGGTFVSTTVTAAQAGWYAVGGGQERYWDGNAWTERVRPVPHYIRAEHRDDEVLGLTSFRAPAEFTSN
jgi:hypothetical protein